MSKSYAILTHFKKKCKKMHKIFGHIKKKQYFCTIFAFCGLE